MIMGINDLDSLVELFKNPVNTIKREDGSTVVEFESGEKVKLNGIPTEFNQKIPVCSFCGVPSVNEFLFTSNDEVYICKQCISLAIKTFLQNGIDVDIPITQGMSEQIKKTQSFIDGK